MDFSANSEDSSSKLDVTSYTRWQDIFRSWFWRYYDHLFELTLYNFGWFLTCFGFGWLAHFSGLLSIAQPWKWFAVYMVYVLECAVSVGWALVVFKRLMDQAMVWKELIQELRYFFWKALLSASLSGLVLGLALYNLWFYFSLQVSTHILVFILIGFVATVLLYGLMMTFYQWPILFFQDPPIEKIFYRSFIITLGTGPVSLLLLFSTLLFSFFVLQPFLWFLMGFVLLFSLYVTALEKHLLRYKITYQKKSISDYLESMDRERQRGWRDILKPWETR